MERLKVKTDQQNHHVMSGNGSVDIYIICVSGYILNLTTVIIAETKHAFF